MFDIYYGSEDFKLDAPEDVVTSILEYGEKKLNMNGNFSLSFVDSQEIQSLNRDYRAKDEVTDILTFSQEDGEEFPSFTGVTDAQYTFAPVPTQALTVS